MPTPDPSVVNGNPDAQFNREEISFSPVEPIRARRTIEGPFAKVRALINSIRNAGYAGTYVQDRSPLATLTYEVPNPTGVQDSTNEQPSVKWKFFANTVEKDILDCDKTIVNGLNNAQRKILTDIINGAEVTDDLVAEYSGAGGGDAGGDLFAAIAYDRLRALPVNIPTLTVNRIVSGFYPVKASLTNVGYIISTAALGSAQSIPGTVLFNLPSWSSGKSGYAYAWLQNFPEVDEIGFNRWNISQTWTYGLWNTAIWGTPI